MTDPRRVEYRAECAAAARRGVIRLKWPKVYSLFLSNLNDNVNEQLLREELLPCGSLSLVKIPTLHGRSLGLARVELQPGVKPDRFIAHFHGRELLGQRMSVIVDQGAKKFEEALNNARSPNNMEKGKEVPQPSPKKQAKTTNSPNYSPASPARPISDSDGPSPSKPKRPRCSSPLLSPKLHEGNRPSAEKNHDTNPAQGERQVFHNRRDSYRGNQPAPRTHPRSFVAKDGPRDYRERYQEGRDRYDNRTSFHNRNRFHPAGSRPHRYESFAHYPSRPPFHRDRYDGHHRNDRRDTDGYIDRYRSPPRQHESGHNRDLPRRHDGHAASGQSKFIHQSLPRGNKPIGEPMWMDDIRPALTVKRVPRGTIPDDLFTTFHEFRPKNTINNGFGNWIVWFDDAELRNYAASIRYFRVRNCPVEVVSSSHVVGRKSTYDTASDGTRRYEGHPRDFDTRNQSGVERPAGNGFGPTKFQHREERISRRNGKYENDRKDPHQDPRTSGPSSYPAVDNKFRSRTEPRHHAPNAADVGPDPRISAEERDGQYNKKGRYLDEDRNRAHGKVLPDRRGNDELRRPEVDKRLEKSKAVDSAGRHFGEDRHKREVPRDERSHARNVSRELATPDVQIKPGTNRDVVRRTKADAHENTGKGDVKETSSVNGRFHAKEGRADSALNGNSERISTPSQDSAEASRKLVPVEKSKKLSAEDFADILARHVYRTAKESIAIRGSAVQKSLVVQNVAKFLKSRRDRENREKERAKQAALARQKADKSTSDKGGAAPFAFRTAHLDLVETFLRPKPKQTKPPLPGRQPETPSKKRLRKSRFSDVRAPESEQDVKPGSSILEDEQPNSPEIQRIKRRRLVLTSSPGSPDAGPTSPDGNRQNSVESVASSELFREKDLIQRRKEDETMKVEESVAPDDVILRIEKPQVRHAKPSSLKLSSPSTGEGSIPHLVLSVRPPPSPARSGPAGSAFTTSEDSTSQAPPKPSGVTKKAASRKVKTGAKTKKRSRGQARSSKKPAESTTDDEQYAGVLLSLNEKIKKPRGVHMPLTVELINESGFVDCNREEYCEKTEEVGAEKIKDPPKSADDKKDEPDECEPDECEPPERVGKCARTDVYVRAEHIGQHRQRNVHARTSTSTQSSRECRQENRVYRKGVSRINPKNDIISLNHLKQRRKQVSFGQSRIHGMGLYAKENIEAGEFIIEYVGDLIRRVVADLREKKYARQGMGDSYLFRLSGDWVVDATRRGGIARYINHSCEPNVIARIISVDGEPKIVFYSKRSIKEGEELTYDYKFDYEAEDQKIPCLCQAPSCRKYLN